MERVDLDEAELLDAARTQVRLLLKSCARFDDGDVDEHLSIAARLRVLLHHNPKRRSHAALSHFGVLDRPWFVASGRDVVEDNRAMQHPLVRLASVVEGVPRFWIPRFDDFGDVPRLPIQIQIRLAAHGKPKPRGGGRGRTFDDWWHQEVIRDFAKNTFSRFDLVRTIANQDGGAHVDPRIDGHHHALTRRNAMGIVINDVPGGSPVPPTIRQIGWEVHAMLVEHLPDLLPADAPPLPQRSAD